MNTTKEEIMLGSGFVEPEKKEVRQSMAAGYLMGALGGATGPDINESGDWTNYWPVPEKQSYTEAGRWLDTNGCVSFGTLNALESLMAFKFGSPENYSDRALVIASGTDPARGNDPHTVAETVRAKLGAVADAELPFSEDIATKEQFYQPNPLPQRIYDLGRSWLSRYTFAHEWVFDNGDDVETKHSKLRAALKKGTVGVSVYAWKKGDDGLYRKSGGDNHWCQLLRFDGPNPVIGDSYDPFEKKLAANYDFGYAKVFYVTEGAKPNLSVLQQILNAIAKMMPILAVLVQRKIAEKNTTELPVGPVDQTPPPAVQPPGENPMNALIAAIMVVESGGNDYAKGDIGLANPAYGPLQIRQPAVDDVNEKHHTNYKAVDCNGNRALSIEIFRKYMAMWATPLRLGREVTDMDRARIWNGGPNGWRKTNTLGYWNKVKTFLYP